MCETCPLRTCRRCGSPEVMDGDWAACPCDNDPALTMTVRETAHYTYVTHGAIYYWIKIGLLGATRDSGSTRILMTTIKSHRACQHRLWRLSHEQETRPISSSWLS